MLNSICLVTFSDSRKSAYSLEREDFLRKCHYDLKLFLEKQNYTIIDPNSELRSKSNNFGFDSLESTKTLIKYLKNKEIGVIIIECNHWSEPHYPILMVKELNIPVILYTKDDPAWAGAVGISSLGSSLLEVHLNDSASKHARVYDDKIKLLKYINAFLAISNIKRSSILLFGSSYCLFMPLLRDDYEFLKSFIIEDIIEIDQYSLIEKAKYILKNREIRINEFLNWLKANNTKIIYDNKMLSEDILKFQIALYFAAKDITADYPNAIGISLKCQPVLSEELGITGCTIPTFMPFPSDNEGVKKIINATCEGDVKGLLTSSILHLINPDIPSLFGDIKYVGKDYIIISNCGGSSLFYCSNSNDVKKCLSKLTISPQCQGISGGAFGYDGFPEIMTIARLTRKNRKYILQYSVTESMEVNKDIKTKIKWGKMWPHIILKLASGREAFIDIVGSNHYSITLGDKSLELETICNYLDIDLLRF
jgi:L-fucose/D-arabinose isomerase